MTLPSFVSLRGPGTPLHLWGESPLLPPRPLPCLQWGHEEGTVQAGLGASEPFRLGGGAPVTTKRNSASKEIRAGRSVLFPHLGSHLWGSQGDPGSSSPPGPQATLCPSLPSPYLPLPLSTASLSLPFLHLNFQDMVPPRPLRGLKVLQPVGGAEGPLTLRLEETQT